VEWVAGFVWNQWQPWSGIRKIKLKSIETVEIDQGILGRIFGFGTVKVTGRGTSSLDFKNIDDPMRVKREIESISSPIE
jgi:hypothetical protein